MLAMQKTEEKPMALSKKPYFVDTTVHIENIKIRVCVEIKI